MSREITLEALFQLQDEAVTYNSAHSKVAQKGIALISDAIELAFAILTSMQFEEHKQTAIRVFGTDAISSIVTGTRVALWGNLPDSIALMRCALETAAILAAIVEERMYKTTTLELQKGNGTFQRFSFNDAIKRSGEIGSRIDYTWGRLSNIGPHVTPTRLKYASYVLNSQSYDRIGFA